MVRPHPKYDALFWTPVSREDELRWKQMQKLAPGMTRRAHLTRGDGKVLAKKKSYSR